VAGYELVERVDERRDAQRPERACQGPGQPDLCEERDAAARVAGNRRPVATHEPPAFVPRVFGHGYEQAAGLVVCERQQSQLFVSVEPGDDTRRPPAEPSGAGIEQDRPRKRRDRHVIGMRPWHRQEPTASNSWGLQAAITQRAVPTRSIRVAWTSPASIAACSSAAVVSARSGKK
jgi:hypothetical protein